MMADKGQCAPVGHIPDSDLMIISASGIVIRTDASLIKRSSRVTQGVTLMHLAEGDTVVAVATTNGKKSDEELTNTLEIEQSEDRAEADDTV